MSKYPLSAIIPHVLISENARLSIDDKSDLRVLLSSMQRGHLKAASFELLFRTYTYGLAALAGLPPSSSPQDVHDAIVAKAWFYGVKKR